MEGYNREHCYFDCDEEDVLHDAYFMLLKKYGYDHKDLWPLRHLILQETIYGARALTDHRNLKDIEE